MFERKAHVSVRSLCLRSGPGKNQTLIEKLKQNTELIILDEIDNWLKVRVKETIGYVYKKYVSLEDIIYPREFLWKRKCLQDVGLKPKDPLKSTRLSTAMERLIGRVWNNFGGLLELISCQLGLDPSIVLAVLCVESSGKGFGPYGRMLIRFENHVFWRYWGKLHCDIFHRHFQFDRDEPWKDHRFKNYAKGQWRPVHGRGQTGEWEAFEFARTKHRRFSMYSISMGMPQIMGFNHKRIGYNSVEKMFACFAKDERNQILGLFDFINTPQSKMITALTKKDFSTFAKLFNGQKRAPIYSKLIQDHYLLFKDLKQKNVDKDTSESILTED